jgi:hypothetical protein
MNMQKIAEWVRRNPVAIGAPGSLAVLLVSVWLFGATLFAMLAMVFGVVILLGAIVAVGGFLAQDARPIIAAAAAKRAGVDPPPTRPLLPTRVVSRALPVASPSFPTVQPVAAPVIVAPPPPTEEANEPQPAPTWHELRAAQVIGNGPPYIGFDLARYCDLRLRWKEDLGSMFIVGMSGAGKTSAAVVLAVQTALDGGALLVGDPHAHEEEESLAGRVGDLKRRFMLPVAVSDDEILEVAQRAAEIAKRRLGGDSDRSPIFLMIDEWTALLRGPRGTALEEALFTIGLEGRKVNVNAALFAQLSTIEMAGTVRSVATTTFAFRTRPDQARYAIGEKVNVDIRRYADGQCYLMARRESFPSVQIPWISPPEMAAVGAELRALPQSASRALPERFPGPWWKAPGSVSEVVGSAPEAPRKRILEAWERGDTESKMAKDVLGAPAGGRDLELAMAVVREVVRQHLRGNPSLRLLPEPDDDEREEN